MNSPANQDHKRKRLAISENCGNRSTDHFEIKRRKLGEVVHSSSEKISIDYDDGDDDGDDDGEDDGDDDGNDDGDDDTDDDGDDDTDDVGEYYFSCINA